MEMRTAWQIAGMSLEYWRVHALDIRIRLAAAPYMVGWRYGLKGAAVAYPGPGIPEFLSSREGRLTNCSTLTASILTSVYGWLPWGAGEYADLQIFDIDKKDSPIQAVIRMGIGEGVMNPQPGEWHLVQGWRSYDPPRGHAFLVRADRDGLTVLEASSRKGIGPRYRRTTMVDLRNEYRAGLFWAVLAR